MTPDQARNMSQAEYGSKITHVQDDKQEIVDLYLSLANDVLAVSNTGASLGEIGEQFEYFSFFGSMLTVVLNRPDKVSKSTRTAVLKDLRTAQNKKFSKEDRIVTGVFFDGVLPQLKLKN